MPKNITDSAKAKKPDFVKIFLYTLAAWMIAGMFFRPAEKAPTKAPAIEAGMEIKRVPAPFSTPSLKGNFNAVGLRLDDAFLTAYRESRDEDSKNIVMLSPLKPGGGRASYVELGLLGAEEEAYLFPSNATEWNVADATASSISLKWKNRNGVEFSRDMSFDDKYMLTIRQKVENRSGAEIGFYPYARAVKSEEAGSKRYASHTGFAGYLSGRLEERTYADMDKKPAEFQSEGGWLGFGSDYFMVALIPEGKANLSIRASRLEDAGGGRLYQADYVRDALIVPAGGTAEITSRVYIGAKESDTLSRYEREFSIPRFDLAVDYGMFYIIAKPFAEALKWLYRFTGNFGWAIVIFTILVRALLFPVAQKSFKSMEKMKKLQPEMKRIQAAYSTDKQRMNMELAMLYKRNGINPLSGCLPILLQIPVFFALYKALVISIEMRQAPFALWIRDLSAPDPTDIFNLFGLLPYQPWSWLPSLGLLPFSMGITMYAQQAMQPQAGIDPAMAKTMKFMPIIFTLLLAGFPSGLVLYWTISNAFSILQQKLIK